VLGLPLEEGELTPESMRKLRDLQVVIAPQLARIGGDKAARAKENLRRLAAAGVPVGVASGGSSGQDTHREMEALAAVLAPMEVLAAATLHGALAVRQKDDFGSVEPGKRADLVLLGANPMEDAAGLRRVERVMIGGEWREVAGRR
jgi:imidazolonepropionase-like amidohydrolase